MNVIFTILYFWTSSNVFKIKLKDFLDIFVTVLNLEKLFRNLKWLSLTHFLKISSKKSVKESEFLVKESQDFKKSLLTSWNPLA
jgi:hypothetical protein